jgi:hypothetical protein
MSRGSVPRITVLQLKAQLKAFERERYEQGLLGGGVPEGP